MSFAIDMILRIHSSRVRETEGKNPFLQRSLLITTHTFYLSNGNKKNRLVNYLFAIWKIKFPELLNECEHLFLANGIGTSTRLNKYSSNELDLVCAKEEADTKMFVYCRYILNNNPQISRIIISSPDTYVAIISCY